MTLSELIARWLLAFGGICALFVAARLVLAVVLVFVDRRDRRESERFARRLRGVEEDT